MISTNFQDMVSAVFLYANNDQYEKEIEKKNLIHYHIKKNKILGNKLNQGDERPVH